MELDPVRYSLASLGHSTHVFIMAGTPETIITTVVVRNSRPSIDRQFSDA
jgi:hypothetical protein